MNLAMIPARMGSQRLSRKNLRELRGIPLITRVIRKCKAAECFDEIWVNSEHSDFGRIAQQEGVHFYQRPEQLGSHSATSEQYVADFLESHECENLFQVHSIAPLLSVEDVRGFVRAMNAGKWDSLLSVEDIGIECVFSGEPVNFTWREKTNSQDLEPVKRICWAITGWRRACYLGVWRDGGCATYGGKVGFHALRPLSSLVIKTEYDLRVAEALLETVSGELAEPMENPVS